VEAEYQQRLLRAFHQAAADMPWYRTLLDEKGVRSEQVVNDDSFRNLCPILTKQNTFDRFPLDQLAATTKLADIASVLTSSGHGGRFSYGLSTKKQASASGSFIDVALDVAFGVKSRATLTINCLPMGVGFSSECMTIATTSVREDMAVALAKAFGSYYDQIVFVTDPLFMKRLTDYAAAEAVDWKVHHVNVVLGEEIFGENFRGYIAKCLGLDSDGTDGGRIISSFGVGELGLHLCYETAATIALRRAAWRNPSLARELLGVPHSGKPLPVILAFNPSRTFIEISEPDSEGYGRLTVSMLDTDLPIPLLRYQPGDVARLLDIDTIRATLRRHSPAIPADMPSNVIALQGRIKEALPNGSHVAVYKDALYADHSVARQLTGAFRVIASGGESTLHVQLAPSQSPAGTLHERLLNAIPEAARPSRLVVWPYNRFPFGMTVDYERKFSYYVPGEKFSVED
jgi:phenylacetate-CoA ligase